MANEEGFPQIPERVAKSLEERTVRFTKEQLVPRSKVPCLNLPDLREIAAYGLPDTEAYLLIECEPSERMTVCPCCKRSGGLVGNGYTESPRLVHDVNVGVRQVDLSVRVPKYRCKFCEATPNHEYESIVPNRQFTKRLYDQVKVDAFRDNFESVAAAYGINPSLVWHSDTQTYASSKDNARALYAECLGPVLQMFQQRINSFLLPMVGADPATYVEFDLTEKLKGSFEERASILQASVGGPWLTRNEARADNNLPPIEGGDELIVPLNVVEGGQASPQDTHMGASGSGRTSVKDMVVETAQKAKKTQVTVSPTDEEADAVGEALKKFFARQRKSILPKIGAKAVSWWDVRRWDKELADDLEPIIADIVAAHGEIMANALGSTFTAAAVVNYIRKVAESRAKQINSRTLAKLQAAVEAALDSEEETSPQEAAEHEFDVREGFEAALLGTAVSKWASGWATEEATRQGEEQGVKRTVYKEWQTGPKARASHAAMDGETVLIYEKFSNGADWPGDDSLDPDESCGCNCTTRIIIE